MPRQSTSLELAAILMPMVMSIPQIARPLPQNWTGALASGVGNRTFEQGDCDGDSDVDSADLTGLAQNWTGAQQGLLVDNFLAEVSSGSRQTLSRPGFFMRWQRVHWIS